MNTDGDILDISSEVSSRDELIVDEAPLLVFRVIGCTVVTVLVGFTVIIYVTSGMFHVDCLAQICSEACILAAYMFILLTTTESKKIDAGMCLTISIFLHFLFVAAFLFSLMEVLCISQTLLVFFQKTTPITNKHLLLIGWGSPAAIVGVSSIVWYKDYTTKVNCWLNMNKPPMWPTVVPIGICISLQAILLVIILFVSEVPLSVPQSQYKRAKCYLSTRWASAIVLAMMTASWACGILAYHRKQETMYAAFTVTSIVLGVCILILRISTDDEIRATIVAHLLCYIVPNNKVTSFPDKKPQTKKVFSSQDLHSKENGKIIESENKSENSSIISHK